LNFELNFIKIGRYHIAAIGTIVKSSYSLVLSKSEDYII